MGKRVAVILNSGAGSAGNMEQENALGAAFERAGISVSLHRISPGEDLSAVTRDAAAKCDIIVAAGGDGTISAVAAVAVRERKTLGVLPLGTLNHFSRDLGIPQEIDDAIDVIARNNVREIDIAEVNGRYFINNSSIGLYPRLVLTRERCQRLGYGKWWAAAWALTRMVRWSPFQNVKLKLDGNVLRRKTPFVFIGNNIYEMDLYNIGTRTRLNEGKLCVYLLRKSGRTGLFLLVFRSIFGGLRRSRYFESFNVTSLSVEIRKRSTLVAMDGEVATMESPLEYKILPRQLRVIAPGETE
jgi:YegS/Rv2252/BmrU family lipid kinase